MSTRQAVHVICLLAMTLLLLSAPNARADLAAWNQAKVTALAKELATTTDALHETFQKQPPPSIGWQSQAYYRLQAARAVAPRCRVFTSSPARWRRTASGRAHTLTIYDNLMQPTRSARDDLQNLRRARRPRAAAVRRVLNQLCPYDDPDLPTLAPHLNIEPVGRDRRSPRFRRSLS